MNEYEQTIEKAKSKWCWKCNGNGTLYSRDATKFNGEIYHNDRIVKCVACEGRGM